MKPIVLLCGVPGSGKTWVARQLIFKYDWVPHDDFLVNEYWKALIKAAKTHESSLSLGKPVLGEAPFRISVLIDQLRGNKANVLPYFILEDEHTVKKRYEEREKREIPKQHLRRIPTVRERAHFMGKDSGTAEEVLKKLWELKLDG